MVSWRALKKSRTRERIADVALQMFLERGFDRVPMADVARAAEVSPSTLFNYFPTKEALVFDQAPAIEEAIVAAIRQRRRGTSVLGAFLELLLQTPAVRRPVPKPIATFQRFVRENPSLVDYERRLFQRYERALARVIEEEARVDRAEAEAVTALAFDAYLRAKSSPHPEPTLRRLFEILQKGWRR
jgi:AcrR family transcriptional regulator